MRSGQQEIAAPAAGRQSEADARAYFLSRCWPDDNRFCPRCSAGRVYLLADERLRCGGCGYTFHDFSGRYLNQGGLSFRQWRELLGLFLTETPAAEAAESLGVTYNTAYKAMTTLREAVAAHSLDAPALRQALFLSANALPEGRPVFGVVEQGGVVFVDALPGVCVETVLHFKLNFRLRSSRLGNIVYTDPYRHYATLLYLRDEGYESRLVRHRDRDVGVDAHSESCPFWAFARDRLRRFRGLTAARFPLYLKELEFRYNRREEDPARTLDLLADWLCAVVVSDE